MAVKNIELIARMPVEIAKFSGKGTVWSFTIISSAKHAPEGFEYLVPYAVAWVRLEEGPLVTAMLTDVDLGDIKIGMEVEMVIRKKRDLGDQGMLLYGPSFRPPISESEESLAETIERIYSEEYEFVLRKKNG